MIKSIDLNENIDIVLDYEEYYLIKDVNAYKVIVEKRKYDLIIKCKNYKIKLNISNLKELINSSFDTINEAYKYIINIFEESKIYIKEIIKNKSIIFELKLNEKYKEIILLYNKENKDLIINQLNNYNKLIKELDNLKSEIKILKNQINKFYKLNNKDINKYNRNNIIIKKDPNLIDISLFTDPIKEENYIYNCINTFIAFKSVNGILYLIIYDISDSILSYNLKDNKIISKINNAHNKNITFMRNYLDEINKRDLILSISKSDNNLKIWDFYNWNCLCDIKNINSKGYLYCACFLNYNNNNYIVTGNDEIIKLFDFTGNKIKEINCPKDKIEIIESYYEHKFSKNFIITSIEKCIKSYDYMKDKLYKIYYYNSYKSDEDEPCFDSFIVDEGEKITKLIVSCNDGNIRIWNIHSALLLNIINICNDRLYCMCLWDRNSLFIGCEDRIILINLKNGVIIKNLFNGTIAKVIKKIKHPKYGECLIFIDNEEIIRLCIKDN